MTDVPDFLRAGEIARLAGVSVRTVRRWIAEETLPSVKLRGVRLVWRKDLELMPCPGPQTWSDPEEEMQVEQEVIS
jgi:excisionase family DNA binding protein